TRLKKVAHVGRQLLLLVHVFPSLR
ncbi:hypothetical protein CIB84_015547, partial [Bambusicola thoracicus]